MNQDVIEIDSNLDEEELDMDVVKAVLKYIYLDPRIGSPSRRIDRTATILEENKGREMDLLRLAEAWGLPALARGCAFVLASDINLDNYEELLLFAEKFKVTPLWVAVRKFIQSNSNVIYGKVTRSRLGRSTWKQKLK